MQKRSPLHDEHRTLDARLVDFGGWAMPLSYPTGTVAEHLACRHDAAVFDVSHLGTVRVADNDDAFDRLQRAFTNDLAKIAPGRAQYTHLLDDDGSVLDDIIVWWVDEHRFDVMPNAANTGRVLDAIGGSDITETRAVLAVQGPKARERLSAVSPDAASVRRFTVQPVTWKGMSLLVAGTGYTGEDGVEITVPADRAGELWSALLAAGITPAGLGARDTLRLEAGLPLHGHELGRGITPLQARLGWVVAWNKGPFCGREALEAEKSAGPRRLLQGLSVETRQPLRAQQPIVVDGQVVGHVTSGNFSPVLERGIAMGFVQTGVSLATGVEVDIRGRRVSAELVDLPFVPFAKRR